MRSDDHPIGKPQASDIGTLSVVANNSLSIMDGLLKDFNLLPVVSFLKQNEERYLSLQSEEEPATTEYMFKSSARGNVQKAIQYYKQVQRHKHSMSRNLLNYNKNKIKNLIEELKTAETLGCIEEALRLCNIVQESISKVKKFLTDNNELNEQDREQLQTSLLIANDFCNTQRIFINKSMAVIERLKFQGNYVAWFDRLDEIRELENAFSGREIPKKRPINISFRVHQIALEIKNIYCEIMNYITNNKIPSLAGNVKVKTESVINFLNVKLQDKNLQLKEYQADLVKMRSMLQKIHQFEETLNRLKTEQSSGYFESNVGDLEKARIFFDKFKLKIIELECMSKDLQNLNDQLVQANTIKHKENMAKPTIKLSPEDFPSRLQQVEPVTEGAESAKGTEKYKILLKKLNEKRAIIVRQKLDLNFWKKTITAKTEELVAQVKDALVYKKENSVFMKDSLKSKIQKTKQTIQDKYLSKVAKIESNLEWLEIYSKKKKSLAKNYDVIRASWQRQIAIIREQEIKEYSKETAKFAQQLKLLENQPNSFSVLANLVDQFIDKLTNQDALRVIFNSTLEKFENQRKLELPVSSDVNQFGMFFTILPSSQLAELSIWITNAINLCKIEDFSNSLADFKISCLEPLQESIDELKTTAPELYNELTCKLQDEQKMFDEESSWLEILRNNLDELVKCKSICEEVTVIRNNTAECLAIGLLSDFFEDQIKQSTVTVELLKQECEQNYLSMEEFKIALKAYTFKMLDEEINDSFSNIKSKLVIKEKLQFLQQQCQSMIVDRQLWLIQLENLLLKFKEIDLIECETYLLKINNAQAVLTKDLDNLRGLMKEISRNLGFSYRLLSMYLRGDALLYLAREIRVKFNNNQLLNAEEFEIFKIRLAKLEQFVRSDLNKSKNLLKILLEPQEDQQHEYLHENIKNLTQAFDVVQNIIANIDKQSLRFRENNSQNESESNDVNFISMRPDILYDDSLKMYETEFPNGDQEKLSIVYKTAAQQEYIELNSIFQEELSNYRKECEDKIKAEANRLSRGLQQECGKHNDVFSKGILRYKQAIEKQGFSSWKEEIKKMADTSFAQSVNNAHKEQDEHVDRSVSCRNLLK